MLVRLTKRSRVNRALAFRARIVLASAEASDTVVVRRLRTTKTTVAKWRSQFVAHRLAGLYDEPRVGAPRTITDEAVEAIIVKTLETTPPGETHWSTRSMAKAVGISHTMVGRIWRTFRLQPHRTESFKLSPDPQLVDKIRDVVGLYIAPPANAVVFSVDEKSQIQALQRAQPILPMDFGQPERRTHNYVRHGTLDLLPQPPPTSCEETRHPCTRQQLLRMVALPVIVRQQNPRISPLVGETGTRVPQQILYRCSEPPFGLICIVRPATELQIIGTRCAAVSEGNDVVILEEAALGAAARSACERALTLVALPDRTLHGRRDMTTSAAAPRRQTWSIHQRVPGAVQFV